MFVRSSASLLCLLYAGHSYAQTNTYTFSSVYEDKSGDVSALWGNNSSKACQTDTALYFTGQDVNSVDQKPVLYENTGSGWSLIWTGPQDDRQAPSVVCDSSNDVHVLYNKSVTGELVHYKFETATSGPAVNAVPTSILTSGLTGSVFHYMVAFATPNNQQLYVAAPQPESATEDSFEVFSFNIVTGLWYSAAPQRLAWRTGQGWVDLRDDGVFIYPVLTANGGRVFAAAEQYEDGATNAVRKQWMFWDSANYGFTKVEQNYFDGPNGQNPAEEYIGTHDYYVGPQAIKQVGNGTVYVLSNIRGANAPAALLGNYLKTYRNGLFESVKIPNTYGAANMTATDDVVVVVEELSVHWSCDAGKTWTKEAHNYSQQSNRNGLLFAAGNVHVMNEVGSDGVVHAFFSHAYKDDPNDANEDPLTQIIHMEFDVSNLCAP